MTGVQTCALPICFPVTIGEPYTVTVGSGGAGGTGLNVFQSGSNTTQTTGPTGANASGFNALGLGWIQGSDGVLQENGQAARYWTTTAYDPDETYYMLLGYATSLIKTDSYGRDYDGYNVRLIKI